MNKLLRLKNVREIVGLSKSEIYRLMPLNQFPKSIPLGERARAWTSESIETWVQSKIDKAA